MIDEARMFPSSAPATPAPTPAAPTAEDARLARMFPSSSTPQTPAPAPATLATSDQPADVKPAPADPWRDWKIEVPGAIAALREASEDAQADRMYPLNSNPDILALVSAGEADASVPPEVSKKAAAELTRMTADIGLDGSEIQGLIRRGRELKTAPVAYDVAKAAAIDAMKRNFGEDYVAAWNDAYALARRDPRVVAILDSTGLGSDPETIVMLAKRARAERQRGRLKVNK